MNQSCLQYIKLVYLSTSTLDIVYHILLHNNCTTLKLCGSDLDSLSILECQDNPHSPTDECGESDSRLSLSPVARALPSNGNVTVEDRKLLYRELLRRTETASDANRVESFCERFSHCRQDFESLLRGLLANLYSAPTMLAHLITDVQLRVTLLKRVRSRRGEAVINSPKDAILSHVTTIEHSDRFRSATERLSRAGQGVEA